MKMMVTLGHRHDAVNTGVGVRCWLLKPQAVKTRIIGGFLHTVHGSLQDYMGTNLELRT